MTYPTAPYYPRSMYGANAILPSTHDESLTHYEQLAHLRANIEKVMNRFESNDFDIKQTLESLRDQYEAFTEKTDGLWKLYLDDVMFMIQSSHDSYLSYDPTAGDHHKSIDLVMNRVYDNLRMNAWFAKQYDDMGLTAAEFDALKISARKFDLSPDDTLNVEYPKPTGA